MGEPAAPELQAPSGELAALATRAGPDVLPWRHCSHPIKLRVPVAVALSMRRRTDSPLSRLTQRRGQRARGRRSPGLLVLRSPEIKACHRRHQNNPGSECRISNTLSTSACAHIAARMMRTRRAASASERAGRADNTGRSRRACRGGTASHPVKVPVPWRSRSGARRNACRFGGRLNVGASRAWAPGRWLRPLAYARSAPSTSASCSAGLTLRKMSLITPSGPITNVERSMPMYLRPYIDFSTHTP